MKAAKKDDTAERKRVAEIFIRQYGEEYKTGDINCDGCTSDSPQFFRYSRVCTIRKCAKEKNIKTCAYCLEYPCARAKTSVILTDAE